MRTVHRFDLLEELGRGELGRVWKAHDTQSRRIVALKLLDVEQNPGSDGRWRLDIESWLGSRLKSASVVQILGMGLVDGVPYQVMEWVPGLSLRERIRACGPLKWDELRRVAVQSARALASAHSKGIVHGSLGPSKILLRPDGAVKLVGLGAVRSATDAATDTLRAEFCDYLRVIERAEMKAGTGRQFRLDGTVELPTADERTDLHALAKVLTESLAGEQSVAAQTRPRELVNPGASGDARAEHPPEARELIAMLLDEAVSLQSPPLATLLADLEATQTDRPGRGSERSAEPDGKRWWHRLRGRGAV